MLFYKPYLRLFDRCLKSLLFRLNQTHFEQTVFLNLLQVIQQLFVGEVDFVVVITVLTFPHIYVFFIASATSKFIQNTVTNLLHSELHKLEQGLKVDRVAKICIQPFILESFLDVVQVRDIDVQEAWAFVGAGWKADKILEPVNTAED